MRKLAYIKILLIFLISAILISGVSLVMLHRLASDSAQQHRSRLLFFIADEIEASLAVTPLKNYETETIPFPITMDRPPFPPGRLPHPLKEGLRNENPPPPPPPPPFGMEFRPGPKGPLPRDRMHLWLITSSGHIFSNRSGAALPMEWSKVSKPQQTQEVATTQDFFRLSPGLFVIKLHHTPELYLVANEKEKPFPVHLLATQAVLSFSSLLFAFLLWFLFTFLYLRKKSQEARHVLSQMEQGNLKSRFEIKKFDEFGELLIDFNRMADEIEKLVTRVRLTESTRKNLLQELGHDLRTPLTSLTTSLDTFKTHFDKMQNSDRHDLFEMMDAEVKYFTELLESLLVIASIDEPSYRQNKEPVDLSLLLQKEIKTRQGSTNIQWGFSCPSNLYVQGDRQLLQRLFKNAFDNASRVANKNIDVTATKKDGRIQVIVSDDGPGLSPEALESFGTRREQRVRRKTDSMLRFSLGLGSVIMKTIAEAHGGHIQIRNKMKQGAELVVNLPESH